MRNRKWTLLAVFVAAVGLGLPQAISAPPAEAVVYPIRATNTKTFTVNDGLRTYTCTQNILLTVGSAGTTARATVRCAQPSWIVMDVTLTRNGALYGGDSLCRSGTTCVATAYVSNPAGMQRFCAHAPSPIIFDSWYPAGSTMQVCTNG